MEKNGSAVNRMRRAIHDRPFKSLPIPAAGPLPAVIAPRTAPYAMQLATPFGVLGIRTQGARLTDVDYLPKHAEPFAPHDSLAERAARQIEHYLDDPEYRFDLPLLIAGTAFQQRAWRVISEIPCGSTTTYLSMASILRTAARPVGVACAANRISIIIPCHRVVSRHGLGGFNHHRDGYFVGIKRWLLQHEGAL
jgi:methylated-DNA-[protein]-cysteine S-methyltransferase